MRGERDEVGGGLSLLSWITKLCNYKILGIPGMILFTGSWLR